jgi:hypothetical protein
MRQVQQGEERSPQGDKETATGKGKNRKRNAASHSVSKNEFRGEKEKNKTMRGKKEGRRRKEKQFSSIEEREGMREGTTIGIRLYNRYVTSVRPLKGATTDMRGGGTHCTNYVLVQ